MVEVAVEDESNGVEGERISGKKNMKHNSVYPIFSGHLDSDSSKPNFRLKNNILILQEPKTYQKS